MPVMDEFREERDSIKNAGIKAKWQYFVDYYMWYVIGGLAIFLFLFFIIRDMVNSKDWCFYGFFLNTYCTEEVSDAFIQEFAEYAGLDLEKYAAGIDDTLIVDADPYAETSMNAASKITAHMVAADVDFIVSNETVFERYATTDNFFDIASVLSEEQLAAYAPYFYYVDMADLRAREEALSAQTPQDYVPPVYDHHSPEGMEEPVAVGIYIGHCQKLTDSYQFTEEDVVIGIPINTKRLETSLKFIDYLMK